MCEWLWWVVMCGGCVGRTALAHAVKGNHTSVKDCLREHSNASKVAASPPTTTTAPPLRQTHD